jgi:hypothetical protein
MPVELFQAADMYGLDRLKVNIFLLFYFINFFADSLRKGIGQISGK